MTRRIRDLRRMLKTVAGDFGASVTLEMTHGQHLRATFMVGNRRGCVIASATPSDRWFADQKTKADARRLLRELTQVSP